MRFTLATLAAAAAIGAVGAFAPASINHRAANNARALAPAAPVTTAPAAAGGIASRSSTTFALSMASDPQQSIDFAVAEAGANGVALFGKSGCPFCLKAKKALLAEGIHPTIVNLDEVEGGPAIQMKLEELTGKSTVPNVWLDGKFIGGSEEVLSGLEGDVFADVERGEVVIVEEEERIPVPQTGVKAGDKVPSAQIWTSFPSDETVDIADYSKGKNILVVGLPGAFTPTWSSQQVPSYIEYTDKLKGVGVDEVIIYCVNDPAVMTAWAEAQKVDGWSLDDSSGFVSFISDADGAFTKACGMEMVHPGPLGVGIIGRCKRWASYIQDGEFKVVNVSEYEGDPAGDGYPEITLPAAMIDAIKAL